mgnify:CR=1 FL=1
MVKVLLKKVCLVVSVLLGLGSNVQAQETASVTFNVSDGDKTLTISGQGDLTTYQAVSDELKFTPDAYTKVDYSNNQKVSATTVYDVNDTYKADYPQKITSLYPDYVSADVAYSWNEDKIGGLFYTTDWGNTWKAVQSSDKVDLGNRWEDGNEYSKYSTTEDKSGRILMADFKKGNYYTTSLTNVTFKSDKIDNLYVVSDNKYVKLAADAKYKDTESYYYFLGNWSQYREINEADLIRMGYLEHPTETLAEMLKYKLTKSNTFETIKFVNTGTGAMTIDKDIVKAILYPSATANSVLTTLDLGAATCKDFSKETFAANGAQGYSALETLTLPLNESKETPAQVVFYLQGQNFKLTHVIVPEGYGKIGANTFDMGGGVNLLTNVTLPNSLTEIGEKAFLYAGKLASIELGANLTYIGKEAFVGTGLTSISFPENLDKIDDGAFCGLNITNLVFNEKLRFIGNSAFALTSEQTETVLMIPASVKYIGPFAFNFRQYQDVYFQGTKAPLMPVGKAIFHSNWGEGTAFSAHTLMGNSGFDPSSGNLRDDAKGEGFANRENYKNGRVYFCIMHYPSSTSDEDAKDFTDTSRTYETCPEGGTWDYANTPLAVGKEGADPEFKTGMSNAPYIGTKVDYGYQDTYLGRQYIWPSQSQWVRSYIVNSYGYNWDGVTKYRSNLTEEDYATLKEAGFVVGTGEGQYTEDELRKIAHMGTRRFVLVNGDSKSTPEYKITMKPGQWWTLCVPFNMTKKQVLDTFGADTQLCLFNKVTRDLGVNGKNKIVLYFTQDVLKHSTKNADGTKMKDANGMWSADIATAQDNVADDDVVLWAHESYMIKPYNGEQSNQDAVFVVKNYEAVEGNPLPTVVQSATTVQSRQASETKEYRFVGNYLGNENARATKVTIPQYSYVYANTKSDPVYKFRFYTGNTSTWKPNKSLVQTNDRNGGRDDYNNFFGIDKSTPLPAGSKQASVFGGENFDETTGIEDVTIVAGTDTLTPVFNLEGKMVSSNGDAAGLPAGIYVKNGQKFMVK